MAMLVPLSAGAGPENTTNMARVHHACAAIMGLDPLDWRYHICVSSLKDSLQQLNRARLVSTDRSTCAKERLKPGTPAFAVCVEKAEQSPADAGRYEAIVPVR